MTLLDTEIESGDYPPAGFPELALVLARRIWNHRVYARGGSVTWFRPASEARPELLPRVRVGPFLYDGSAGIAVFLAAMEHVAPGGENRLRSLQALAAVRRKLAELVAEPERGARITNMGIGGIVGLGSLMYSFVRIGEWLGEPDLIVEAHALMTLMTPERIDRDEGLDVLSGSAGAILALLALDRARPEAGADGRTPLAIADACARHLIARRLTDEGRSCAWRTLAGFPPLAGFSHGASGILYALTRLYERTGDLRLLDVARGALEFERSLYSRERGNWRDMRSADDLWFGTNWCVGAAGITLARLELSHTALDCEVLREDLCNGLQAVRESPLANIDYLCCGNMGRAEVLHHAFLRLGGDDLRCAAEALAGQVAHRAGDRAAFRWRREMADRLFDPSFFTGASGVGYTLLRLSFPSKLPCILLLE